MTRAARKPRAKLRRLGRPGLSSAQVGLGFNGFDVGLVCTLDSREALDAYQCHPAHMAVKEYVHTVIAERVCCDFEN